MSRVEFKLPGRSRMLRVRPRSPLHRHRRACHEHDRHHVRPMRGGLAGRRGSSGTDGALPAVRRGDPGRGARVGARFIAHFVVDAGARRIARRGRAVVRGALPCPAAVADAQRTTSPAPPPTRDRRRAVRRGARLGRGCAVANRLRGAGEFKRTLPTSETGSMPPGRRTPAFPRPSPDRTGPIRSSRPTAARRSSPRPRPAGA